MARSEKEATVAELTAEFRTSDGAVLTEYRGLNVKQLQDLRRALGANASYAVVKNTLTKLAAKDAGVDGFDDLLVGPTAIAFIKGDAVEAAKSLRDFAKDNSPLVIKGGILDGKTLTVNEISKFADLESREALLAKLAGALLASLSNTVYLLNAPLSQAAHLVGALQAKAEQNPSMLTGGDEPPAGQDDTSDNAGASSADPTESPAAGEDPTGQTAGTAALEAPAEEPDSASASSETVTAETTHS